MKFFDANSIIGTSPENIPCAYKTPESLLESMDRLGIERAVVSSFEERRSFKWDDLRGKKEFLQLISPYRDRLIPCLSISSSGVVSDYGDKRYLNDLFSCGVNAFKYIAWENAAPLLWTFDVIAEQLIKNKAVLFIEILSESPDLSLSHTPPSVDTWNHIFNFAREYPELNIVIFSPKMSTQQHYWMNLLRHCGNVRLDISGIQSWRCLEKFIKLFNENCFVFGSYSPYFEQLQFILEILYAGISDENKEKIAWKNLASMLQV